MATGMPSKIAFCPITPECSKRSTYIDVPLEEVKPENVFEINSKLEFVPHVCTTARASSLPSHIYMGEFVNGRTKRTRYMGPFRSRAQAEKAPKDDKYDPKRRQIGGDSEWSLVKVHVTKPTWKVVLPK